MLMGRRATVSAGIAFVHYKEDLRLALGAARRAEKAAKDQGRDALEITVVKRSGETTSARCPWPFAQAVQTWVKRFQQEGISDRWAYRLRAVSETVEALPVEAAASTLQQAIQRSSEETRKVFNSHEDGRDLVSAFHDYRRYRAAGQQASQTGNGFVDFITLCQTASFLARGKDR